MLFVCWMDLKRWLGAEPDRFWMKAFFSRQGGVGEQTIECLFDDLLALQTSFLGQRDDIRSVMLDLTPCISACVRCRTDAWIFHP